MKIINPKNASWLQAGDGTAEISWEFYRRQNLLQFPIGKNPNYGLEISNSIAFDGAIPLLSLIFRPISFILFERFQYFGFFVFISFALNYVFAKKIFKYSNFSNFNAIISSLILSTSPVILNRYIENTHYALTAAYLIFYGIYLVVSNNVSVLKWNLLFLACVLIHFYYVPFVLILFIAQSITNIINKSQKVWVVLFHSVVILISNITVMYIVGFFYGGVSSSDVGYGLFRATLLSLLDSSGWSKLIPDLAEPDGAYEGFSFVGTSTFALLIMFVFLRLLKKVHTGMALNLNTIWISSIILFLFSLSNRISFGKLELFDFPIPEAILPLASAFRSSGRFTWLLVFTITFWVLLRLNHLLKTRNFSLLLIFSLLLGVIDSGPHLISQRNIKFSNLYKTNLTNGAWKEIYQCYDKIRIYPPVSSVDNYYNFVNLAKNQDLGINTGRFSRVNNGQINSSYSKMNSDFIYGTFEKDSFYVFTTAAYIIPEVIEFRKNMALFGLNDSTMWGNLNGFTVIAPNISQCASGSLLKLNLGNQGLDPSKKYNSDDELKFGLNQDSSKYILSSFSSLQEWGVWSVGNYSDLIIHLNIQSMPRKIYINGKIQSKENENDQINIEVDGISIGTCKFDLDPSECVLDVKNSIKANSPIQIRFIPKNPVSPKELSMSEEAIPYGLGLISVKLTNN